MAVPRHEETDSLANLEERISRAVELVSALRRENQQLTERLETVQAERDGAQQESRSMAAQAEKLGQELEELRSERKQVRGRIEKLLGQMDLLTNA